MKQEEIRKCTKVVELFRSMMDELGDMCVVYDKRFGFIVLELCASLRSTERIWKQRSRN